MTDDDDDDDDRGGYGCTHAHTDSEVLPCRLEPTTTTSSSVSSFSALDVVEIK